MIEVLAFLIIVFLVYGVVGFLIGSLIAKKMNQGGR